MMRSEFALFPEKWGVPQEEWTVIQAAPIHLRNERSQWGDLVRLAGAGKQISHGEGS